MDLSLDQTLPLDDSNKPIIFKPSDLGEPIPNASPFPNVMEDDDDIDDDDLDETLAERLWGLTEMFPDGVRAVSSGAVGLSWACTKWMYSKGRVASWVVASSATILAMPVMFEMQRAEMEEEQLMQQKQLLLGPNAAMSGSMAGSPLTPGSMPTVSPPKS